MIEINAVPLFGELPVLELPPIPKIKSLEEAERTLAKQITYDLAPQMLKSTNPLDQLKIQNVVENLTRWRKLYQKMGDDYKETCQQLLAKKLAEFEGLKKTNAALTTDNATLKAELRAAQELRGTYESKRVTELEGELHASGIKLTATEQELATARDAIENRDNTIRGLFATIETYKAQAAGYERDISQLTTAAAGQAEAARQLTEALRRHVGEACEKIDDRWGNDLPPFIAAIRADLAEAQKRLK